MVNICWKILQISKIILILVYKHLSCSEIATRFKDLHLFLNMFKMPHAFSRKKLLFWKITLRESTLLCFPLFSLPFFPLYFLCCSKKNKQKIWQMRSFSNIGSFFHGVNWILFNNSNLQISFQYHHSKKEVSIFILILSSKKKLYVLHANQGNI